MRCVNAMIQPGQIRDEIKKRPPLQRIDAEKSYRGIKISWKLKFKNARQISEKDEKWEIYAWPEGNLQFPEVYIEIEKGEIPTSKYSSRRYYVFG